MKRSELVRIEERLRDDGFYELDATTINECFEKTVQGTPTMQAAFESASEEVRAIMRNAFRCGVRMCEMVSRETKRGQN